MPKEVKAAKKVAKEKEREATNREVKVERRVKVKVSRTKNPNNSRRRRAKDQSTGVHFSPNLTSTSMTSRMSTSTPRLKKLKPSAGPVSGKNPRPASLMVSTLSGRLSTNHSRVSVRISSEPRTSLVCLLRRSAHSANSCSVTWVSMVSKASSMSEVSG